MGKQIGFYLTFEEENILLREIINTSERIVDSKGKDIITFSDTILTQYYIIPKNGKLIFYEQSEYFNSGSSDIIQFCRTEYNTKRGAEPGRIWTELRYWDEEENLILKDKELDDLYKKIVKMIKRHTTKIQDSPFYISRNAQDYIAINNLKIS